jgi:hypothetical protein
VTVLGIVGLAVGVTLGMMGARGASETGGGSDGGPGDGPGSDDAGPIDLGPMA